MIQPHFFRVRPRSFNRFFGTINLVMLKRKDMDLPPFIKFVTNKVDKSTEFAIKSPHRKEIASVYEYTLNNGIEDIFVMKDEIVLSSLLNNSFTENKNIQLSSNIDLFSPSNYDVNTFVECIHSIDQNIIFDSKFCPEYSYPSPDALINALEPIWVHLDDIKDTPQGQLMSQIGLFSRKQSLKRIQDDPNSVYYEVSRWLVILVSCCESASNQSKKIKFYEGRSLEERVNLARMIVAQEVHSLTYIV